MIPNGRRENGNWDPLGRNLVFLFSPERSGSTLLRYMIESHPRVGGMPETWMFLPLQYLGYYDFNVSAGYEAVNQSNNFRRFIESLPGAEKDFITACRAYCNVLLSQAREGMPGVTQLLEKTPSHILVWELIEKIFPASRCLLLIRNPLAVCCSAARTFYKNDFELMYEHVVASRVTPLLEQFRSVAGFVERASLPTLRLVYEIVVTDPEQEMKRTAEFLEIAYDPAMVEYGYRSHRRGAGDPATIHAERRPVPAFADRWRESLKSRPDRIAVLERIMDRLEPGVLEALGYRRETIFETVRMSTTARLPGRHARRLSRPRWREKIFLFQRRVLFVMKRWLRFRPFRRAVEQVRFYCDVLLRP